MTAAAPTTRYDRRVRIALALVVVAACAPAAPGVAPSSPSIPETAVAQPSAPFVERCLAWAASRDALPLPRWDGIGYEDEELSAAFDAARRGDIAAAVAHADPRVRALAASAAAFSDDPTLLPLLAPLLEDDAPTLARSERACGVALRFPPEPQEPPPVLVTAQTVAVHTRDLLSRWFRCSPRRLPAFLAQVATEDGARASASVWLCRLERCVRTGQSVAEVDLALAMMRERMEREAPRLVRAVVLLMAPQMRGPVASSEDLDDLATRVLSREETFAILRRERWTSDPLFDPDEVRDTGSYAMLWRGLLAHRRFAPSDVDPLLDVARTERAQQDGLVLPGFAIAAARATPDRDRAVSILKDAWDWYPETYRDVERWTLLEALWDVAGLSESDTLLHRIFGWRTPYTNSGGLQTAVVEHVGSTGTPDAKRFLRLVLTDPRAESLTWPTLLAMVHAMNRLAGKDIVPESEWRNLHHPLGEYHFARASMEALRKSHPEETERVLRALDDWRRRLREHAVASGW